MRRPSILATVLLAALLAPAAPAAAQEILRPELAASADTNDWEAYYDAGVEHLRARRQVRAHDHFVWASRLDPTRAEPHYARWVAFWARDPMRYMEYLDDVKPIVEKPEVVRNDSVRALAFERNPLVYQGLQLLILDQVPNLRWRQDPVSQGWLSYATLDLPRAAEQFRRAIARDPRRNAWVRYSRALVLTAQERYDSAAAEMQLLLAELRQRDERRIQEAYLSKAFVEYTIGRLALARGDAAGAEEAFGRALAEDLAYVPAHAWMGNVVLARGDIEAAIREYAQAVELRPLDGTMRWLLGRALGAAGRDEEAIAELRRATELEPRWAEPWFSLALALERDALPDEAVVAYRAFVARAPRNSPNVARATSRLAALNASR